MSTSVVVGRPMPFYVSEKHCGLPLALTEVGDPIEGMVWFHGRLLPVGTQASGPPPEDPALDLIHPLGDSETVAVGILLGPNPLPHYLLADGEFYPIACGDDGRPLEGFLRHPEHEDVLVPVGLQIEDPSGESVPGLVRLSDLTETTGVPAHPTAGWSTHYAPTDEGEQLTKYNIDSSVTTYPPYTGNYDNTQNTSAHEDHLPGYNRRIKEVQDTHPEYNFAEKPSPADSQYQETLTTFDRYAKPQSGTTSTLVDTAIKPNIVKREHQTQPVLNYESRNVHIPLNSATTERGSTTCCTPYPTMTVQGSVASSNQIPVMSEIDYHANLQPACHDVSTNLNIPHTTMPLLYHTATSQNNNIHVSGPIGSQVGSVLPNQDTPHSSTTYIPGEVLPQQYSLLNEIPSSNHTTAHSIHNSMAFTSQSYVPPDCLTTQTVPQSIITTQNHTVPSASTTQTNLSANVVPLQSRHLSNMVNSQYHIRTSINHPQSDASTCQTPFQPPMLAKCVQNRFPEARSYTFGSTNAQSGTYIQSSTGTPSNAMSIVHTTMGYSVPPQTSYSFSNTPYISDTGLKTTTSNVYHNLSQSNQLTYGDVAGASFRRSPLQNQSNTQEHAIELPSTANQQFDRVAYLPAQQSGYNVGAATAKPTDVTCDHLQKSETVTNTIGVDKSATKGWNTETATPNTNRSLAVTRWTQEARNSNTWNPQGKIMASWTPEKSSNTTTTEVPKAAPPIVSSQDYSMAASPDSQQHIGQSWYSPNSRIEKTVEPWKSTYERNLNPQSLQAINPDRNVVTTTYQGTTPLEHPLAPPLSVASVKKHKKDRRKSSMSRKSLREQRSEGWTFLNLCSRLPGREQSDISYTNYDRNSYATVSDQFTATPSREHRSRRIC